MISKKYLEMEIKLYNAGVKVAEHINETYWLTKEGTPLNLGSRINCCGLIERDREHEEIFSIIGIHGNNKWLQVFKKYKLVQVVPESKVAICLPYQHLTKHQKKFIEKNKLELIKN